MRLSTPLSVLALPLLVTSACVHVESSLADFPEPVVFIDYDNQFEILDVTLVSDTTNVHTTSKDECVAPSSSLSVTVDGEDVPLLVQGGWVAGGGSRYCAGTWFQLEGASPISERSDPTVVTLSDGTGEIVVEVQNLMAVRSAEITAPTPGAIAPNAEISVGWSPSTDVLRSAEAYLFEQSTTQTTDLAPPAVDGSEMTVRMPDAIPPGVTDLSLYVELEAAVVACGAARCAAEQTVALDVPVTIVPDMGSR